MSRKALPIKQGPPPTRVTDVAGSDVIYLFEDMMMSASSL